MEKKSRKRILLLLTNAFASMNVIHSGLIRELVHEYEIYIVSDYLLASEIAAINRQLGIDVNYFPYQFHPESRLIRLLRRIEKALFFSHFKIKTQKIKELNEKSSTKYLRKSVLKIFHALRIDLFILKQLRKIIILFSHNGTVKTHFKDLHFDGIISSSPFDFRENQIVNNLQRPSVAIVISWDNLTTKGVMNANHDNILVWNKFMAAEYEKYHGLLNESPGKIKITGIPRFDVYFNHENILGKVSELKIRLEVEPFEKIILFATSAVKHFPNQIDIVSHLVEYACDKPNVKIIVRCHPGDDASVYNTYQGRSDVKIWVPPLNNDFGKGQLIASSPLRSLAEMLLCCDVCVNVASTLRLDAAACNRPIISIAYDGNLQLPFRTSVRRLYEYSHQLPLNALKIDTMVFSKAALFKALDSSFLQTPASEANLKIRVKEFTHFTEPVATHSTMNVIREWLN